MLSAATPEEGTHQKNEEDMDVTDNLEEDEENEEDDDVEEDVEGPQDVGGFTVLGEFKAKEKKKVERILPNWLRYPVIIQPQEDKSFCDIQGLDRTLVEKLKTANIQSCFPVQWTVIPELLAQCECGVYAGDAGFRTRDICVSAPTGSGKTLTFALPIIQALQTRVVPHVRALVILPVRDLAVQVYKVFEEFTKDTPLKVVLLAGKKEFQIEQKNLVRERPHSSPCDRWASAADIVVATKGRLLDHIDFTDGFDLTHLRFLVIDEADRQMEDIYDDWLSQIEAAMYRPKKGASGAYHRSLPGPCTIAGSKEVVMHPQKLLFSATLSQNPEKLEQLNLFMPILFTSVALTSEVPSRQQTGADATANAENQTEGPVAEAVDKFSAPVLLKEKFMDCKAAEKPLMLLHFVITKKFENVLCFANSVESAHRLFLLVKQMSGVRAAEISSNIHTEKRERIIRRFERGDLQLLICSDVMTRGMDIENVKYVISYDAPSYIETYIHRVGRTARAHKSGTAITMLEGKEVFHFKKMLRESGRWGKLKRINVNRNELEPLVPQFKDALKTLPEILKEQRRQKKAL
ncbi:ATP-dependent RNA helicase DDX51 [Aplysia californica]|uniref:ATP-dependent RNA helicase n=1 Tax=Aplysia californica TaxID=6500 RepID=A0ABM0K8T3_APLCA|nr:ATP-dependent RNA helicase DDX51 [Aplysia californica]